MTGELPMDYPAEPPRRLTRKERRLLSRILADLRADGGLVHYCSDIKEVALFESIQAKVLVKRRRRG